MTKDKTGPEEGLEDKTAPSGEPRVDGHGIGIGSVNLDDDLPGDEPDDEPPIDPRGIGLGAA